MRTLFHGSRIEVKYPEIRVQKFHKDFFWGFYCTTMEEQAARWSIRFGGRGVVNIYSFDDGAELTVKRFPEMSDEWLDFIAACRSGVPHSYDVGEGPMADDTIFNYVQSFLDGEISRAAFWELARFKHPTHQISFHTAKALAALRFERSYLYPGLSIRAEENQNVPGVEVVHVDGLAGAASSNTDGIRKETINGKEYYTRVMYVASATSTWIDGYTTKVYSADNAADEGSFTIKAAGGSAQFNLFLANNPNSTEQSYIISDPAYTTVDASASFKWSKTGTEDGSASLEIIKTGPGGGPLEGAEFELTGDRGTTVTGKSGPDGKVSWTGLPADEKFTLTETTAPEGCQPIAPEGCQPIAPMNVTLEAGRTSYLTVPNDVEKGFTVKKIDAQNRGSLQGAVFAFEQIDGDYKTTGTTGFDGQISFEGDELPYGSYRVWEQSPPEGYSKDERVETVEWTGERDVLLTFQKGAHLRLTPEEQAEIREAVITRRPEEFGIPGSLWTLKRVCAYVWKKYRKKISDGSVSDYMRR